jgi:hypothetical protein
METSIKPQPSIAEMLPGFTALSILSCAYFVNHQDQFAYIAQERSASIIIAGGFAVILVAWIIGTLFDAVRDILEHLFDFWWPVNWRYLLDAPVDKVNKLDSSWLAYYFHTGNTTVALLLVDIFCAIVPAFRIPVLWLWGIFAAAIPFGWNTILLRREIRRLIGFPSKAKFPHIGVYTRLAPSKAKPSAQFNNGGNAGVGVFAIKRIPKGTLIFAPDDDDTVEVKAEEVDLLPEKLKKLYTDFCVLENGVYTCPVSFNKLTPAWYPNDSDEPNIECDTNLQFRAIHDIEEGDEITSRYADYSE